MASLDRTAYPRYGRLIAARDLHIHYTVSADEMQWLQTTARGPSSQLACAVLLKGMQHLGFFPALDAVPTSVVAHLRAALDLPAETTTAIADRSRYNYYGRIRERLGLITAGRDVRHRAVAALFEAAQVMDNPADLINVAVEALRTQRAELPAFSTLDRLTRRVRTLVNRRIAQQAVGRLSAEQRTTLESLLESSSEQSRSLFNDLKLLAKRPSYQHLDRLLAHLAWLDSLGDFAAVLDGIPPLKVQHFAAEAKALDVAEVRVITAPKQHLLLACLVHRTQTLTRDALIDMFRRRVATFHKQARTKLEKLQLTQRGDIDRMLGTFRAVLDVLSEQGAPAESLGRIGTIVTAAGGAPQLIETCESLAAWSGKNYLPLLWPQYRAHRQLLFRMLDALTLTSTSQDSALVDAVAFLQQFRVNPPSLVPATVNLSFASEAWRRLITTHQGSETLHVRKHLEVCVFSYLAQELHTGDIAVGGSAAYTDLRDQLLPWSECVARLPDYCEELALPSNAKEFVADLQRRLESATALVDQQYPANRAVVINERGEPILKRGPRREPPASVMQLGEALLQNTPERHLLDMLHNVVRWTNCIRHFGPLSGADPKFSGEVVREDAYVRLLFSYGTHLGPGQAARHMRGAISAHSLSYLNQRHVTSAKLDAALADIVNCYHRLPLPKVWGDGTSVAADGTAYALPANNPLAEYHFRYRTLGGVAYRHIADSYIATFSQFTPCGVWEAVYLIEGLLGNQSDLQPTTVYSDTQGQSTPVFALANLLGIELLPRIRNWKDLILYKADVGTSYEHIDSLFGGTIDWGLIERHWQDLMQVVLSIRGGRLSSATLLRKLRYDSKRNRVYKVFQEVGRVIRTLFLLRYISDMPLREEITAETNKVESFHGFADWLNFGSDGTLTERDPEESEKLIKYGAILANAVILHNVYDMTNAINTVRRSGQRVFRADLRHLSPYSTTQIKRFGDYLLSTADETVLDDALAWSLDEDEPLAAPAA